MNKVLSVALFCLLPATVVAEDKLVDPAGVAAMGKVINSVPEYRCTPTDAVYKGAISGRVYILTHCQSGTSYAVHFRPDGTDTQVTDCAVGDNCAGLTSGQ